MNRPLALACAQSKLILKSAEEVDSEDMAVIVPAATSPGNEYTVVAEAIKIGADAGLYFDKSPDIHSTDMGHCKAM